MITVPGDITSEKAGPLLASAPMRVRAVRPILFPGNEMPPGAEGVHIGTVDGGRPLIAWFDRPWHDERHMRMCFDIPTGDRSNLEVPVGLNIDTLSRWLARHHGLTCGATAPSWLVDRGYCRLCGYGPRRNAIVLCDSDEWARARAFVRSEYAVVPGISALTDPAAALRLAILAAVGRTE